MAAEQKECPDCGVIMRYSEGVYSCLDPECGYVEDVEEVEEEEDEDTTEDFTCPHCGKIIDEDDLP